MGKGRDGGRSEFLIVALIVALGLVVWSSSSAALSCSTATLENYLSSADVGFVGTLEAATPAGGDFSESTYTFAVESWLVGDLTTETVDVIWSEEFSAPLSLGERLALFPYRNGSELEATSCQKFPAAQIDRFTDERRLPGGDARFVVAGRFSAGEFALIDANGDLVGFVGEPIHWDVGQQLYQCHESNRAVLVDEFRLAHSLDLVDFTRSGLDLADPDAGRLLRDVWCDDSTVRGIVEAPSGTAMRTSHGDTIGLDGVSSFNDVVVATASGAVVERRDGDTIELVHRADATRVVRTLDRAGDVVVFTGAVVSPDGMRLAVSELVDSVSTFAVVDLATGETLAEAEIPSDIPAESDGWGAPAVTAWEPNGHIVTTRRDGSLEVRSSETLEVVATAFYEDFDVALVDDRGVWGDLQGAAYVMSPAGSLTTITESADDVVVLAEPLIVEPRVLEPLVVFRPPVTEPMPATTATSPATPSTGEVLAAAQTKAGPRPSGRGWWWGVGGASVLALLAGGAVLARRQRPSAAS